MNCLFVVAHPDDEVLGSGATISKLVSEGHNVHVCILSGSVEARTKKPKNSDLNSDIVESLAGLGVESLILGEFPNIKFNLVSHLELVQFIESIIEEKGAEYIFTHHPSDVNIDHRVASYACQAAFRVFQRKSGDIPIKSLLFMEILSSTDWNVDSSLLPFSPNTFIEAGIEHLNKKLVALSKYRGVMREYPHPRSEDTVRGLAAYRGSQSGLEYAEAFQCVFRRGL